MSASSTNFLDLFSAELLLLRRRVATWVLLGTWTGLGLLFGYIVPYAMYRNDDPQAGSLAAMLPDQLVSTLLDGFPFFGGAIALILGVMTIGSEFGWDTLKTLFTQRPGRGAVFAAKMVALGIAIVPFVVTLFAAGGIASVTIARLEGVAIAWPDAITVVQGILAGWMVLAVWAAAGVLLAVATRGTSLAIGIGILYTLVIEGLVSALAGTVSLLEPVVDLFLRANTYSLVRPLGGAGASGGDSAATAGPGAFSGPYVDAWQAAVVLAAYVAVFLGAATWLLRRRDVA
jgi:ABC-type transport system involved in multi-copper enzyme maturation permease subunit